MEYNAYGRSLTAEEIGEGAHRSLIGGQWDELGHLQLDFMVERGGLTPDMTLLDLGCGCLRGGVYFVRHLDRGNYYGMDLNRSLVDAGYEVELARHGLSGALLRDHLLVADDFGVWRLGVDFDRVVAISLWTHLPWNHIQRSLYEVARVLKPDGSFYATFFLCGDQDALMDPIVHEPGGITTHRDRDPYHYTWEDIVAACRPLGLGAELIGDWGHPRAQQMAHIWRR